jgi:hypothetical protein
LNHSCGIHGVLRGHISAGYTLCWFLRCKGSESTAQARDKIQSCPGTNTPPVYCIYGMGMMILRAIRACSFIMGVGLHSADTQLPFVSCTYRQTKDTHRLEKLTRAACNIVLRTRPSPGLTVAGCPRACKWCGAARSSKAQIVLVRASLRPSSCARKADIQPAPQINPTGEGEGCSLVQS